MELQSRIYSLFKNFETFIIIDLMFVLFSYSLGNRIAVFSFQCLFVDNR